MKATWLTILITVITCNIHAQIFHKALSATYNGTVACSKNFADVSSFAVNQAVLSNLKHVSAAVYTEKKYLLKELSVAHAAIAFPAPGGMAGIAVARSGSAGFHESQLGIAYGKALGKAISLGAQINYHLVGTAGYGNASAIGFELGALLQATDKLYAGLHVCNPAGGRYGSEGTEKLSAIFSMALGYEASESLLLSVQTKKTEHQPVDIQIGIHYVFARQFFARAGMATASSQSFAGVGLLWKNMTIQVTGSYHLQLGITPALQLIMRFQKGEE